MSLIGVTGPGVLDTSTTTGAGTYTLAGAIPGYQSVGAVLADGDTGYFAAIGVDTNGNRNGDGWEEFYGTYTASGTTLARTSVLKSSNSNNAVSWPAGTRRIVLLDLPSKSKGLNAVIAGITLPNAKFVRIQGVNLNTGDNDLYTVPAGKRAFIGVTGQIYNNSAGSITWYWEIKVSGTYYRLSSSLTTATGDGITATAGIVLEPGETFAVNVATTNGLNALLQAIEFDSIAPLFSPKLLTLASGDQTLYTCPTGKTAIGLGNTGPAVGGSTISVVADGTGQSVKVHLVPSGNSVGNTYKIVPTTSIAANVRQAFTFVPALGAGDFININVSAGAPPLAYTTVAEIGN